MGCQASDARHHGPPRVGDEDGAPSPSEMFGRIRIMTTELQEQPVDMTTRVVNKDSVRGQRERASSVVSMTSMGSQVALDRKGSGFFRRVHSGVPVSQVKSTEVNKVVEGLEMAQDQGLGCHASLEERLRTFGMKTKVMQGDGNCQFRSFAFNLFGEQAHHACTRQAAVAQMKKHQDFFGTLFESSREFKAYLKDMSRDRTWGDELTLRAVVEAYGCEAHVITSEPANWYLVYRPESSEKPDPKVAICPRGMDCPKPGRRAFLAYVSPVHYNAMVTGSHNSEQQVAGRCCLGATE
eukprot:TRINITY_DN35405_c0_g1_i1.p1 TRINITY_DN35405_c0_g1~~TRINITY_DN35405_c0_g1_i1.p1  ORF type:complete len:340 (+),score=29.93 TRINITY_DN35405_c0_g1_i1:138-1022(+)